MGRVRTFGAGLATLIAIIAMVGALPSLWVHYRVVDREGFTSFVSPMAHDRQIQDLMADEIAAQISDQTGGTLSATLVRPATGAYTRSDQFVADFADVLGQQHDWLFTEPTTDAERNGVLTLDLTEMVNRAIRDFGISGVRVTQPVEIPLSESRRSGLEAGRYATAGDQVTRIAFVAAGIAAVFALLALILARRRGFTLAALGVGAVIASAVSWVLGVFARGRADDEVAGAQSSAKQIARIVIDSSIDDLHHTSLIVGGVGVAAIAVGILVSLTLERSRR